MQRTLFYGLFLLGSALPALSLVPKEDARAPRAAAAAAPRPVLGALDPAPGRAGPGRWR